MKKLMMAAKPNKKSSKANYLDAKTRFNNDTFKHIKAGVEYPSDVVMIVHTESAKHSYNSPFEAAAEPEVLTVGELIEELQQFGKDHPVVFGSYGTYYPSSKSDLIYYTE